MLHVNIRSISKNLDKLVDLLMQFSCPPSLIALSETNLKPFKVNGINIPGYEFIHSREYINKGGVGLFIKENMSFTTLNDFNLNCSKCENLWVRIFFNKKDSFVLGVIYRHPGYDFSEFHHCIIDCMHKLNQGRNKFLICGDINIDILQYGNTH